LPHLASRRRQRSRTLAESTEIEPLQKLARDVQSVLHPSANGNAPMTSVSSNLSLLSYISSISKSDSSDNTKASTGSATDTSTEQSQDPIGDLRKYAAAIVAQSRGGLFSAMAGVEQTSASQSATSNFSASSAIQLPDVASMSRDDAASLLPQVQKLLDKGLGDSVSVAGFNADQQTDSLETYRDWLQSKAGISVYV
jgi:hypothetical protein